MTAKHGVRAQVVSLSSIPKLIEAKEASARLEGLVSPERLVELAEQGYAPAWWIDGRGPLFQAAEIKKYVAQNLTARQAGYPPPRALTVIGPQASGTPPPALANMVDHLLEWNPEGSPSCVYFLVKGAEVVYVGQAVCAASRIREHAHAGEKAFERALILPTPRDRLDEVERAFIRALNPRYNRMGVGPMRDSDVAALESIGLVLGAPEPA